MKSTIQVIGMTCGHCKKAVERALSEVNGVTAADVDLKTGEAAVTHDDSVTIGALKEAVNKTGIYTAK